MAASLIFKLTLVQFSFVLGSVYVALVVLFFLFIIIANSGNEKIVAAKTYCTTKTKTIRSWTKKKITTMTKSTQNTEEKKSQQTAVGLTQKSSAQTQKPEETARETPKEEEKIEEHHPLATDDAKKTSILDPMPQSLITQPLGNQPMPQSLMTQPLGLVEEDRTQSNVLTPPGSGPNGSVVNVVEHPVAVFDSKNRIKHLATNADAALDPAQQPLAPPAPVHHSRVSGSHQKRVRGSQGGQKRAHVSQRQVRRQRSKSVGTAIQASGSKQSSKTIIAPVRRPPPRVRTSQERRRKSSGMATKAAKSSSKLIKTRSVATPAVRRRSSASQNAKRKSAGTARPAQRQGGSTQTKAMMLTVRRPPSPSRKRGSQDDKRRDTGTAKPAGQAAKDATSNADKRRGTK